MSSRVHTAATSRPRWTSQRPAWATLTTALFLINIMGGTCGGPTVDPTVPDTGDGEVLDDQPDNPAAPGTSGDTGNTDNPSTPLQLAINLSPTGGVAPVDIAFVAVAVDGRVLPDGTYAWDFGDSATATGQSATHTYATAGAYTVTLTLTLATGSTPIRATAQLTISEPLPTPVEPVGVSAEYELTEDEPIQLTLAATQADGNTRYTLVTTPVSGTLNAPAGADLASPVITYTPAAGFVGDDTFTFSAYSTAAVAAARTTVSCAPACIHLCVRRKGILSVSPDTALDATGAVGGPFSPATTTYTLKNVGQRWLNWTAAQTKAWISLDKTSGSLAPGATDTVTVTITSAANALVAGNHTDIITFLNTTSGRGNTSRGVKLAVSTVTGVLAVSPSTAFASTGNQGGPFAPASVTYTLTNTGGQSIDWAAGKTANWLSLSKTSGTLAAGATATVTVTIATPANALNAGTYSDTVTFTNITDGTGNTTRAVSLTVNSPAGVLSVSPASGLTSSGYQGGPFSPSSRAYTLTNTGGQSINWTAAKNKSWLSLSKTSGTLAAGAHTTVTVSLGSGVNSLAIGSYSGTVTFTNTTNGSGNTTRSVALTVNTASANLAITPSGDLSSSGRAGGPFTPTSIAYTLTNTGGQSLNWTAAKTQDWVTLSKNGGALAAGATDALTVSLGSAANSLGAGTHSDTVTITNTTNGAGNGTRGVSLTVTALAGALTVSPAAGLTSSGTQGGPFTPSSVTYTLTNTGGASVNWTATKTANWLALSKTSGTLAAGATDIVTVSFASAADSLATGSYTDTVTITNTINGSGDATRAVALTVTAPPGALSVTPSTDLSSSGDRGGPFTPANASYTLTNTGGQAITWTAAKTANWVSLSKSNGTLAAGGTDTITLSYNNSANSLASGAYTDTLTITNATNGTGNTTRAISLTVNTPPGALSVTPSTDLSSSGVQGGPFSPASVTYTLTNTGGQSINWTAARTQTWVTLGKTSGTLAGGATDTVVVSIGNAANSLIAGSYSDTVTFTNATNGSGNATRAVSLTITPPPGALSVTPITQLVATGVQGGPFTPASATYTVTNTGGQYIAWSVTKTANWISLSKSGGGLNAGATDTVTVSFNANANALVVNAYSDTVTFTNGTNGVGNTTRTVSLTVTNPPGALNVTPAAGLAASGHVGGTFSPASVMYTLSNTGGSPITWTATKTASWLNVSKTSGTLAAGATDTTILSINLSANSLPAGTYTDAVTFTNTTNNAGTTTRAVSLTVTAVGAAPPEGLSMTPATIHPAMSATAFGPRKAFVGHPVQASHPFKEEGAIITRRAGLSPGALCL